jgi:3-methyladenine DNA glycosylase AlkD
MKSAMPFQGLTTPELRTALRPLLASREVRPADSGEWQRCIRQLWDEATVRGHRYAALEVGRARWAAPWHHLDLLPMWRHLIETGAWWDLVDVIAPHLVGRLLPAATDTMIVWASDDHLWLRRAAIVCQLARKHDTDRTLLAAVIEPNLEGGNHSDPHGRQDFFIRKGIGWALREFSYRDPEWVREFIATHHTMAPLTVREASKRLS